MARKCEVLPPYLAKQTLLLISVLIREREYFSRNVMVSIGVSRMGKTRVVFIDSGAKANSSYYCNIVLEKRLLPHIRTICRHYRWTLQQDGAPSHTARTTMDYPKKEHINFIEPHMWPPNSPNINPVDYAIWNALQQRVYNQRQFKTVEECNNESMVKIGAKLPKLSPNKTGYPLFGPPCIFPFVWSV